MKRTYPANIDGQIFYIDEDAFELLNNYLEQLRLTFRGTEGQEIVGDIESRIRELFSERIDSGASVIVLADVNRVIETMGRPEDLSEDSPASTGATPPPPPESAGDPSLINRFNLPGQKRLYRNMRNKVFGGVFGGIATYLGWNAAIMRLLYVILFISLIPYSMLPLTILYLLLWMIIPAAVTPQQLLQMNGQPVNVGTVGQAVMESAPAPQYVAPDDGSNLLSTICTIIGKLLMSFMGLCAGAIAVSQLAIFIAAVAGIVSYLGFGSVEIFEGMDILPSENGWAMIWAILLATISLVALFGLMTWGAFAVVFNFRGAPRVAVWTTIILSVMFLIAAGILALVGIAS